MINRVIEAGGRESRESQDHGWMYGRSFEDINGHMWEIIYMDNVYLQQQAATEDVELRRRSSRG